MELTEIDLLRKEVARSFGRKILASADCHHLGDDIANRSGITLSFNTLRRFFHLMRAESQPSLYTLDALARYCGYASFNSFSTAQKKGGAAYSDQDLVLLDYLISLFKHTEANGRNDNTYYNLMLHTINYLKNYPHLVDEFQREIAKTKNGQAFYFEQFVNVDRFNASYGQGLHYYAGEKRTKEAQVFANALLCFGSFLTMDDAGVETHYNAVMRYDTDTTTLKLSVLGHFFATQLYHACLFEEDFEPILSKARRRYTAISFSNANPHSFFYFELILSGALILTEQYKEALFYINQNLRKQTSYTHTHLQLQLAEAFRLYKAIALAHTGREAESRELFMHISPTKFYTFCRQYFTILYLQLKQTLFKKNTDQEQLRHLVHETGFRRLWPLQGEASARFANGCAQR